MLRGPTDQSGRPYTNCHVNRSFYVVECVKCGEIVHSYEPSFTCKNCGTEYRIEWRAPETAGKPIPEPTITSKEGLK